MQSMLMVPNIRKVSFIVVLLLGNRFGQSYKQKSWKRLFDPGPGSYDIPSTIAGMPSYLNQNASRSHTDESRFSNYIKEVNEKIEQTENF